jgi:dipeptidyl aminopeptidase/acylaminoacyl peptidase
MSKVAAATRAGGMTGLTWTGKDETILVAQSASLIGDQSGALSRVLLHDLRTREERTLFWAPNLYPSAGPYASFTILEPGVLVYDESPVTQSLVEFSIEGGFAEAGHQWARGNARDRQPSYSPDGRSIIFSSNRSGNLDLWVLSTETGTVRQLTDDAAQDWDPGFSPDGESIVWSSDRSGNLEAWIANKDGSGARQLTDDGRDAENPTVTPDGWVLYWSAHPEKRGVWKIRTDGTEATRLIEGSYNITDVSPDGRFCAFVLNDLSNFRATLHFVNVETGELDPVRIELAVRVGSSAIGWGRPRWTPDGKAIAFVGENEDGLTGIFVQDFVPGKDTSATRRRLAGFSPDYISESFDISPDGKRLTLAVLNETFNIMIAEDVPGVVPPARGGR